MKYSSGVRMHIQNSIMILFILLQEKGWVDCSVGDGKVKVHVKGEVLLLKSYPQLQEHPVF